MFAALLLAAHLFLAPPGATTLPADVSINGIYLHAVVDGHPLLFMLDSGAESIVIDGGVAHGIGLPTDGVASVVTIGAVEARNVRFRIVGYDKSYDGQRVAGIIGFQFFRSNRVAIDYPHHTLTVFGPGFDPSTLGVAATPIAFIDGRKASLVHLWYQGKRATMLLDTGAFHTVLFPAFAKHLTLRYRGDLQIGLFGDRVATAKAYAVSDVLFGNTLIRYAELVVPDPAGGLDPSPDYDGIVGRDLFSPFKVVFDYADSAIYLIPEVPTEPVKAPQPAVSAPRA